MRATGGGTDQLELVLGGRSLPDMTVRVNVPADDGTATRTSSSMRVQVAVIAPGEDDDPRHAVRVEVALSDAVVADPVLARSDAPAGAASDSLDLWVPLRPDAGGTPATDTATPSVTEPPPASPTDTTVPVEVVVPVASEEPETQTVDLPPVTDVPAEAPPSVTVGVDVAPGAGASAETGGAAVNP